MRTTHFCSLVLSALFLTSISAYAVQTEKDCEAMIANGREAVVRGNKLAANPRTKLESRDVLARGNDAIERGRACLHALNVREKKLDNKKDACDSMSGNWFAKGDYCYVVRNYSGTLSEEDNPKALRCNQSGLGYDTWTKECYTVLLPAKSNCEKDSITDFGQKGPPSCAPLAAMQCMARGGIWNSTDEPNHCDEKAAANVGLPPAFVTGIKPGKAAPAQTVVQPVVQPVQQPGEADVRQPSTSTGNVGYDPKHEIAPGLSIASGRKVGANQHYTLGMGLFLTYYSEGDCRSKVAKQMAVAGTRVDSMSSFKDSETYCQQLFASPMGEPVLNDAIGTKMEKPGKKMRYFLTMDVSTFLNCVETFANELSISSADLEIDGEADNEESAIKYCRRVYPDVSAINNSTYKLNYVQYDMIHEQQVEKGPFAMDMDLDPTTECEAMEQARGFIVNRLDMLIDPKHESKMLRFTAYGFSKNGKLLCKFRPSEELDYKNLPECKCGQEAPPVSSPDRTH